MDGHFYVDEYSFGLGDIAIEQAWSQVAEFSQTLALARDENGIVYCINEIWQVEVFEGVSLAEFLWSTEGLDHDSALLLGVNLDQCAPLLDIDIEYENPWPGAQFSIGRLGCMMAARDGQAAAVLAMDSVGDYFTEQIVIDCNSDLVALPRISRSSHFSDFWRSICLEHKLSPNEIAALTLRAFPDLDFVEGVWSGVKDFDGAFDDLRPNVVRILGGLNDHMITVLNESNDANLIQTRMKSLAGVECSRESNNTRNNAKAMKMRRREFLGADVVFEWHAKIEPHRNRIHFAAVDGRIVIGIFCNHLP